ncbi:MAG: biotin transporter BioY [Treponema sp.]|jgi:biotin transport system substrate-specific component|nr:biotin transporter BioY [Treponema sp.]
MGNNTAVSAKRKTLTALVLTSLFAALIAAGTFISIPLPFSPVPIVLQNLFAVLAGLILGPIFGGAAVALYLTAGVLGAPVFAGAAGGIAHFAGPTGGFLFGYLLAGFTAGLIAGRPRCGVQTPLWKIIAASAAGFLIIYVSGVIRLKYAINKDWAAALTAGVLPFIIGDAVKGVIAVVITRRLRRAAAAALEE